MFPAIIFPNAGGRFQFSQDDCQQIAEGCRGPMGRFQPALPSPSGGMKLDRVPDMRKAFGDDTLFLIGGALLEQGPDLEIDARLFAHCAGRDRPYCAAGELCDDPNPSVVCTAAKMTTDKANNDTPPIPPPSFAEIEQVANAVRRRVLEYTLKNNGGYLSQACSSAETLATLYLKSLRLGPSVSPPYLHHFRDRPGLVLQQLMEKATMKIPPLLTSTGLFFHLFITHFRCIHCWLRLVAWM